MTIQTSDKEISMRLSCATFLLVLFTVSLSHAQQAARARDLGIPFEGAPGPLNAITDVQGVDVGHTTLISGEGKLVVGQGPVRTGVTAVLPRGRESSDPVFAGWFSLNGNGEMTGTTWVEEGGFLEGPVMITNTHPTAPLTMLSNEHITPLFTATVEATEEAIVNAMVAARTMHGAEGRTVIGLPHDRLREVMRKYNRLREAD
jgi:L-aminopeptidase/D-esterase-like protein